MTDRVTALLECLHGQPDAIAQTLALRDADERVDEALYDLVANARGPSAVERALQALQVRGTRWFEHALDAARDSPRALVRRAALEQAPAVDPARAYRALVLDASHQVRMAAVARVAPLDAACLAAAACDPHWRVRNVLVSERAGDARRLPLAARDDRTRGLFAYLHGEPAAPSPQPARPSVWDDDPAVLARQVAAAALSTRDALLLADHEHERVRRAAVRVLLRAGSSVELAQVWARDPRSPGASESRALLELKLDQDRLQGACALALDGRELTIAAQVRALRHAPVDVAARFCDSADPLLREAAVRTGWAVAGLADAALADASPHVQRAAALCIAAADKAHLPLASWRGLQPGARAAWFAASGPGSQLNAALEDADAVVRAAALASAQARAARIDARAFIRDPDPRVRAVALVLCRDLEHARADPSPIVWAELARATSTTPEALLQRPAPAPQRAPRFALPAQASAELPTRLLGDTGLAVTRLGVSGHYGLAPEGFARALAAGINFFFWEPAYAPQTAFLRGLGARRDDVVIAAGSFAATPAEVGADLERALRMTGLQHIDLFLLFWVRSPGRLAEDVTGFLDAARARGTIRAWGMSTHQREIALDAIERGVDPVMVRHNAAHRGAEHALFPAAAARGTGLITFSNLLYGRLLRPLDGYAPSAAECYAYSLSFPAVSATLSAPADAHELEHNLTAVSADRAAQPPALTALLRHGERVHAQERYFREQIRR